MVPTLNLKSLTKLDSSDHIGEYISDTETLVNIPSNVDDIEIDYKQMNTVMTTSSKQNESFNLTTPGMKKVKFDVYKTSIQCYQLVTWEMPLFLFLIRYSF